MAELFADLPSALANSVEIARRCSLPMTLGKPRLPDFPTPGGESLDVYLRRLASEGLEARLRTLFPDPAQREEKRPEYEARLAHECDMIIKVRCPASFRLLADFIIWPMTNAVPVGPGRGSGARSLAAIALGITDLDPIPSALPFARFLNP